MICMLTILAQYLLGMQDPCQYAGLAISMPGHIGTILAWHARSMPRPCGHDTCLACKIHATLPRHAYCLACKIRASMGLACLLLGWHVGTEIARQGSPRVSGVLFLCHTPSLGPIQTRPAGGPTDRQFL